MPADKAFYFNELRLEIPPGVYEPKEDSILLAENISLKPRDRVLDIGTGSGLQALVAAGKGAKVVAVDINPKALDAAGRNAENNRVSNIDFRLSDLFSGIDPKEKFDLILFNPPYVPSDEKDLEAKAWAGGKAGRETIDRFIEQAPKHLKKGGRILLLVSSLNHPEGIKEKLRQKGLRTREIGRKKIWFEQLILLESVKN